MPQCIVSCEQASLSFWCQFPHQSSGSASGQEGLSRLCSQPQNLLGWRWEGDCLGAQSCPAPSPFPVELRGPVGSESEAGCREVVLPVWPGWDPGQMTLPSVPSRRNPVNQGHSKEAQFKRTKGFHMGRGQSPECISGSHTL